MENWWDHYPWRNIQTNLRDNDMEDIDAKEYVAQLKELGATVTLLNAAGISANYDTQLDFQPKNEHLHGSSLEEIVEECHRAGIKVFCRTDFSKIRRDVYEKHPDWAFRDTAGEIMDYNGYVAACLNGDYQKIYIHQILQEVLTKIPFDGLFCNMGGMMVTDYDTRFYGICQCESCKKKFQEMYGEELPKQMAPGTPSMLKYMAFRERCEKEHKQRLIDTVRGINPQIVINGLDYIRSESGSDMKRPPWIYNAASNARKASGPARKRLADSAAVDFMGFRYRHTSVSPALMELRQWQNLANCGGLSVFIMGHLGNHRDMSWYEGTKKVFDFHKEHEELYTSMVSDAKVALVWQNGLEMDKESQGWVRALSQSHIPFDEIYVDELQLEDRLEGKTTLILGNISVMTDEAARILDDFVEKGGTILATGGVGVMKENYTPRRGFALKCIGAMMTGRKNLHSTIFEVGEDEESVFKRSARQHYIAPGASLTEIRAKEGAKSYLTIIPEHPYGPPEICGFTEKGTMPGVVEMPYGAGKSVYLPFMIGDFYVKEGHANSLNLMQDVLFEICGIKEMAPELTPMVELNVCKAEGKKIIQLINDSGCFGNHFTRPLPVYDVILRIEGTLEDGTQITRAETLRGGTVTMERDGSDLLLYLNQLRDYEAIVVS